MDMSAGGSKLFPCSRFQNVCMLGVKALMM